MPHSTLPGALLASAILLLALLAAALAAPAAPPPGPGAVTLAWDYDTNSITPDLTFCLLSCPAADAPLSKWQTVAAIPATNVPRALTITGQAPRSTADETYGAPVCDAASTRTTSQNPRLMSLSARC